MTPRVATARDLADLIEQVGDGFRYENESGLHGRLGTILLSAGYDFQHEVRLDARSRIDFLVDRVGIEVKINGTRDALARQVIRYNASPRLDEVLVVTTRLAHQGLPIMLGGKPVHLVQIGGIL